MSKNRLDISDNTAISMPVRNMLAIIGAVAVGVWAYVGVLERITMLETTSKLAEKDLNGHIERITNGASALATRCIEIASGSPLTEAEKNATKKSEINPECPSIANPNYIPY